MVIVNFWLEDGHFPIENPFPQNVFEGWHLFHRDVECISQLSHQGIHLTLDEMIWRCWMKWFEDGFHQNYWKNYEKTAVEFQIWGCLGMNMQHSSGRVGTASWQDLLVARSQLQVQDVHYEATTISVVPEGFWRMRWPQKWCVNVWYCMWYGLYLLRPKKHKNTSAVLWLCSQFHEECHTYHCRARTLDLIYLKH